MRKHTKFYTLVMAVVMIMSLTVMPANAATSGGVTGAVTDRATIVIKYEWLSDKFGWELSYAGERGVTIADINYDTYTATMTDGTVWHLDPDTCVWTFTAPDGTKTSRSEDKPPYWYVDGELIETATGKVKELSELPAADVGVPLTLGSGWGPCYDLIRITHVVGQESVECDGELLELYSIYPHAMLYKVNTGNYSAFKWYVATMENGVLKASGQVREYVAEDPKGQIYHLSWDETDVGDYYVAEVIDEFYTKKIGFHIVEGTLPEYTPVHYANCVGFSQKARAVEEDGLVFAAVPVGTVVTLPYDTKEKAGGSGVSKYGIGMDTDDWRVPTYICNGKKCFTVEAGQKYEINYLATKDVEGGGMGDGWVYIAAEDTFPTTYTANPTNDALKVDGKAQVPTAYKIGDSNYFQLRDVAMLLNGTKAQFSVDYDAERQAVIIVTGQPYKPLGTELAGAAQSGAEAILGNNDIYIDGVKTELDVYKINGSNFFKIRDLAQALGFNVGWTKADGMFIETDKSYDPND